MWTAMLSRIRVELWWLAFRIHWLLHAGDGPVGWAMAAVMTSRPWRAIFSGVGP